MAYLILISSLFYYIGKALYPAVFTGQVLYPALLALGALLMIVRPRLSISRTLLIFGALVTLLVLAQGFYGLSPNDLERVRTYASLYYGVAIFVPAFYAIFSFSKHSFNLARAVRNLAVIVAAEVFVEFVLINWFHAVWLMVHYDEGAMKELEFYVAKTIFRPSGLLGNSSDTAAFLVALLWFYVALRERPDQKKSRKVVLLIAGASLACLSGTGFVLLLLTLLLSRLTMPAQAYGLVIIFIALFGGLLLTTSIEQTNPFVLKLTGQYIQSVVSIKVSQVGRLFEQIRLVPSILLFGAPSSLEISLNPDNTFASSDNSMTKMVADFGVTPAFLYAYLFYLVVHNRKFLPGVVVGRPLKLGVLTLFLGSFHYPVMFSVPAQALIGALAASALYGRYRQSLLVRSKARAGGIGQPHLAGRSGIA